MEAKIIETRYIEDVVPLVDENTWLLVDLDNCMFEGAQALGHANWFYDELRQRMQKGMSREEAMEIEGAAQICEDVVIDPSSSLKSKRRSSQDEARIRAKFIIDNIDIK